MIKKLGNSDEKNSEVGKFQLHLSYWHIFKGGFEYRLSNVLEMYVAL